MGSEGLTSLRASKEGNTIIVLPKDGRWSLKWAEEWWHRAPVSFAAMATNQIRNSCALQPVRGWTQILLLNSSHQSNEVILYVPKRNKISIKKVYSAYFPSLALLSRDFALLILMSLEMPSRTRKTPWCVFRLLWIVSRL